jgi:hypothetical protein
MTFDKWLSEVDFCLEQMVKRVTDDFPIGYDFNKDFNDNISPEETAVRLIRRAFWYQHKENKNGLRT